MKWNLKFRKLFKNIYPKKINYENLIIINKQQIKIEIHKNTNIL